MFFSFQPPKSLVHVALIGALMGSGATAVAADPPAMAMTTAPAPAAAPDAAKAWWLAGENPAFTVEFVGQAAGPRAMAIRFSKDVGDPALVSRYIRVMDETGAVVAANWQTGAVAQVLVWSGLKPGRYSMIIDPRLTSARGDALNTLLNGPVLIQ